ncbi:MAG: HAD family hydrolase [Acutalibacteraceae bacterium]
MKIESVVFDLDGTLLDTLGDLRDSVNFALVNNSLPIRSTEEIRAFVGNGIRRLIERAVPENTPVEIVDKCFSDFKEYYKNHSAILTKAYDGIIDLMKTLKLKGIKIAVVSNKADFAVKTLMEDYFSGLYDCAYGERTGVGKKPAPDGVFGAMSEIEALKESTIYIGDSEVDIETAKNAGLPCVSVTWGFRDKEVLENLCPEYIVDSPKDILNIIERGN